jgi:sulfate transport system ATP-binding protein
MSIEIRGVTKRFGAFTAVDTVDLKLDQGDLVALLGPSGSGKSTLLRMIAGLDSPDAGEIRLTGRLATELSPKDRNIGFVFQHYALFKHMTVAQNIAFGLEVRKVPRARIDIRVAELLELIQLGGLGGRYPSQLSGGQRQRAAVARALAPEPKVLLLDEPFGALDAKVRAELRAWVRRLHEATGMTTLFVTHDQDEAMEVANRIVIMNRGRIEQQDAPRAIFDRPATRFVAEFVGESNRVDARAEEAGVLAWGPLRFPAPGLPLGEEARVYFRPHEVYLTRDREDGQIPVRIAQERFKGAFTEFELELAGGRSVLAHLPRGLGLASGFKPGEGAWMSVTGFHVFTSNTQGASA